MRKIDYKIYRRLMIRDIMDTDVIVSLTICGSAKFRNLKEKYQAYYTIKNNLVFAPVNYLLIKKDVEKNEKDEKLNAFYLNRIHCRKINASKAIIVVNPDNYYGSHTADEINHAKAMDIEILYTCVPEEDRDKYYFNNDETYPLYMLKEEYL